MNRHRPDRAVRPGTTAVPPATPCRDALRDVWPGLLGLAPFGLLIGVTLGRVGLGGPLGLGSVLGFFSGGAHLAALTLIAAGSGPLAVIGTVALGNARLALYGAALAPRFRGQPWWFRWFAPHLLIDLSYALTTAGPERTGRDFRRYWLTLGAAALVLWIGSHVVGLVLGPALPEHSPLDIAAPALFVGMLVPQLTSRPAMASAGAGAITAIAVSAVAPNLALLVGGIVGLAVGSLTDREAPNDALDAPTGSSATEIHHDTEIRHDEAPRDELATARARRGAAGKQAA